jgi:Ca2+-transporting ATPase
MNGPPRDPAAPILNSRIWMLVAFTGSCLAAIFLLALDVLYAGGIWTFQEWDHVQARSLAFYTLVTARLMNAFNFQDLERSLFSPEVPANSYLRAAVMLSWVFTLALVLVPGLAGLFGLSVLPIHQLLLVTLVLPLLVFLPAEIFKKWKRS